MSSGGHSRCGARSGARQRAPGRTPHRLAERGERGFGHQAICLVHCPMALLDELRGSVARCSRPLTQLLGEHRATVEMAAHALGQVRGRLPEGALNGKSQRVTDRKPGARYREAACA